MSGSSDNDLILDHLVAKGLLGVGQVQHLKASVLHGGDILDLVLAEGIDEEAWLAAGTEVFGLCACPSDALVPTPGTVAAILARPDLDIQRWSSIPAVPFFLDGQLHVAFQNSTGVLHPLTGAIPPHRAVLTTPQRLHQLLDALRQATAAAAGRTMPLSLLSGAQEPPEALPSAVRAVTLPKASAATTPSNVPLASQHTTALFGGMPPPALDGLPRPALGRGPLTPKEAVQALLPASSAMTGRRAAWTLLRPLGAGAAADVHLAENASGQKAAFKQLRLDLGGEDPSMAKDMLLRFEREANLVERLAHVNVVRLFDRGIDDNGQPWIASEFVDGGSVDDLLHKAGPMPVVLAMRIVADILRGLEAAHGLSVVHRDLKPANLLLTKKGTCKVADFGVAKADDDLFRTAQGVTYGSPAYMSPEQARGLAIDARSDLFAVGSICVELLTGKNPFDRFHIQESLQAVCQADPGTLFAAAPGLPALVDTFVRRLLAPEPEDRFQSATEALEALQGFVDWVESHEGGVVARALAAPRETVRELRHREARLLERQAQQAMQQRPPRRHEAGLALGDAVGLCPADDGLRRQAEALVQLHVHPLESRVNGLPDGVDEVTPDERRPDLVRKAGLAHFEVGNVREARFYLRRFLQLSTNADDVVSNRLRMLQGEEVLAPFVLARVSPHQTLVRAPSRHVEDETERVERQAGRPYTKSAVANLPSTNVPRAAVMVLLVVLSTAFGAYWLGSQRDAPAQDTREAIEAEAQNNLTFGNGQAAERDGDTAVALLLYQEAWNRNPRSQSASRAALAEANLQHRLGEAALARDAVTRSLTGQLSEKDRKRAEALLNLLEADTAP